MKRFLVLILLFVSFGIFVEEAFPLEIELQKESERIIDSKGWIIPQKVSFQEQIQVIIDETEPKNRISISMVSTNPNDIRLPEYLEDLNSSTNLISFTLTNQFACEPNKIESACIIIEIDREGLGGDVNEIKKNTREITDKIVDQGVIAFSPEFSSITVESKVSFDGSDKISVVQAKYTINKQPTHRLFTIFTNMLLNSDITTSGGFYEHAKKLSENEFSDISLSIIPIGDKLLRGLHVSLTCSDRLPTYVGCPEKFTEEIKNNNINPLDFIKSESINRSKIFSDEFLPLNSVIHIVLFSEKNVQVKEVNTNIITKIEHLGDVQDDGWFFVSKSGKKIDGRYLFGQETTVTRNNLSFSIGDNKGTEIIINENGGCLIATAAFDSELAPQVQLLREIRDGKVMATKSGSIFMNGFNQFYYSFSPAVADYERENPAFKEVVKTTLTPLLMSLALLNHIDIDSEHKMLGYGIGIILLNIGMYFIAPAIIIMKIKKLI